MAENGKTRITWKKNKFYTKMIILSIILLIPYPFLIYFIWNLFQDTDFIVGISLYLILPFAFFGVITETPTQIGYSSNGIHGKYIRKPKKNSNIDPIYKTVILYSDFIGYKDIIKISRSVYVEKLPSLTVRIYIQTKANIIYKIEYCSKSIILNIVNEFNKSKRKIKNITDISKIPIYSST